MKLKLNTPVTFKSHLNDDHCNSPVKLFEQSFEGDSKLGLIVDFDEVLGFNYCVEYRTEGEYVLQLPHVGKNRFTTPLDLEIKARLRQILRNTDSYILKKHLSRLLDT